MTSKVDRYLMDGCGRCPLGGTPGCKVHTWQEELAYLRMILLDCGLTEDVKWSVPCYTSQQRNVLIISAFKEYCALSFFKGSLLKDAKGILVQQTENVQLTRQVRFTNLEQIIELESILKEYIYEAVEVEQSGLKPNNNQEKPQQAKISTLPEELQQKLTDDATFKTAFESLTPGRQRGYILYFSAAKQAKTRASRIEKYMPKIFAGKGLHD